MKAIVCVKQVPDTSGKVAVNPDGTLNRASMATIINPDDKNAVEAALKLKDNTGCKVIVVSMGPPRHRACCASCLQWARMRLSWYPPVSSAVRHLCYLPDPRRCDQKDRP